MSINIFDLMKQSRNAALYRMMYMQRMHAMCAGGAAKQAQRPDVVVETQDALKDALRDVKDGGLIQIAGNIDLTGEPLVVPKDKTVTVDLNGSTVSTEGLSGINTSDALFAVRRGGTLIIEDTAGNGVVDGRKAASICCALKLTEKGEVAEGTPAKIVINGGTYIGNDYGISGNGKRQDTEVTINGGTFRGFGTEKSGKMADGEAIYQPQRGTLTINGGEFEGTTAVYVKCGTVTINGGTFHATAPQAEFNHYGNGTYATGDAFVVEACDYPGGYPTVQVNGGKFVSDHASGVASYAQNGHDAARPIKFVKGGSFSSEVPQDLLADGYSQTLVDGMYVVSAV